MLQVSLFDLCPEEHTRMDKTYLLQFYKFDQQNEDSNLHSCQIQD